MQAYWNNPENKYDMMTLMLEEGEGFPPVRTPDSPLGQRRPRLRRAPGHSLTDCPGG